MKILGVIPARFASSRLPGKPLLDLKGKSLIQRVFENALSINSLDKLVVATDDSRIETHLQKVGIPHIMTSPDHPSGTDRCNEVVQNLNEKFDFVANIQGDEPFIDTVKLDLILNQLTFDDQISTVVHTLKTREELESPNVVKVALGENNQALYFSRSPIPFIRDLDKSKWLDHHKFFRHIGLYIYRTDVLQLITSLDESLLEKNERLEQLRWLSNGFKINCFESDLASLGIDTKDDLLKARELLGKA